ncbi:MAG: hypothetical protein GKS06_00440 [Acidobacteria bacterium]|nr:hypothetical protein [Acidobacteriota bacterium]
MNDGPATAAEAGEGVQELIDRLHREAPLTDVHAHPSMKSYLFGRDLWTHVRGGRNTDPEASRSDFEVLQRGGVRVVWTAHYVVEDQLVDDAHENALLRTFARCYFQRYGVDIFVKLRVGKPFDRLLEIMSKLEAEVTRGPQEPHQRPIEFARNPAHLRQILGETDNRVAFVHTVEGAHALTRDGGDELQNLEALAARGVAMLTLNHFYWNGYAEQDDAMPSSMPCRSAFNTDDAEAVLTDRGRALLHKARELGILLDLAHCTESARDAIYAEMGTAGPLVISHTGVRALRNKTYNLRDEDIDAIAATNGAIGVILMSYWLGEDHDMTELRGAEAVWRVMRHIHERTQSWDHIMIGTDFDGFTDPPDDLPDASFLDRITLRMIWGMKNELAMPGPDIEVAARKVLGGNAMRVLETGWTGTD